MKKFRSAVDAFIADENGVSAIEYALLAALIGVAASVAMGTLGKKIAGVFGVIETKLP